MPHDGDATARPLDRALTLRDLVLFNLVAVLGLRWVATSAKAGPSALVLWVLAAILFFIPQGLAVVELSARFPDEGGIYAWAKRTFGEAHGFLCGWCYWINNVLYYPNLLISTATVATYAIGRGGTSLANDWTYVLLTSLCALWLAAGLNIVGLSTGKWLQNAGGFGTYIPGVILILVGLVALSHRGPANPITAHTLRPELRLDTLNLWASIAFAFAGLELASTMGDEIQNPRRNLPRSIYIAAPLVALAYVLGTGSVVWIIPAGDLNIVAGFLQAIEAGARSISPGLVWIAPVAAALYSLGTIGGVGAWLTGPARVAFVIGLDRYFPPAFGRVHPRWRTPYVAILVQAALASVFLLLSVLGKGTTVEQSYLILLDTQLIIYFIPYVYLFLCFLSYRGWRERGERVVNIPGGRTGALVVGTSGLLVTLFAIGLAAVPPSGVAWWTFELKVVGGALAFIVLGAWMYRRGVRRAVPTASMVA